MRKKMGTHLVADIWDVPSSSLNDPDAIVASLRAAVEVSGATLIDLSIHQFSPHGITAAALLAESHIAIHTWPEEKYAAVDAFYCGTGDPERAVRAVAEFLGAGNIEVRALERRAGPIADPHRQEGTLPDFS